MTLDQQIKAISLTGHDPLLKAQCISILREISIETKLIPMPELLEKCSLAVGVQPDDVRGKIRITPFVRARQLFVHYALRWFNLVEIGVFLNRDHTTIMHSRDSVEKLLEINDDILLFDLENMERVLGGGEPIPMITNEKPKRRVVYDNKTGKEYKTVLDASMDAFSYFQNSIKHLNRRAKSTRFEWKYLVSSK